MKTCPKVQSAVRPVVKHAAFSLEGQEFAVMDTARAPSFTFNAAISVMVYCDSQEEIDQCWDKLPQNH